MRRNLKEDDLEIVENMSGNSDKTRYTYHEMDEMNWTNGHINARSYSRLEFQHNSTPLLTSTAPLLQSPKWLKNKIPTLHHSPSYLHSATSPFPQLPLLCLSTQQLLTTRRKTLIGRYSRRFFITKIPWLPE